LASAVIISSFVALSLVPAAAARLVKGNDGAEQTSRIASMGAAIARAYHRSLHALLARPWVAVAAALLFASGAGIAYQSLDKELVPAEDRGTLRILATGPEGVGVGYMDRQTRKIEDLLEPVMESGDAELVSVSVGNWDPNRSFLSVPLADWSQRERTQQDIAAELREQFAAIPGARVGIWGGNSLNLSTWRSGLRVALLGNDYDAIYAAAKVYASLRVRASTSTRRSRSCRSRSTAAVPPTSASTSTGWPSRCAR
jgi:multidrug efflux pump subunit AcrB